MTGISNMILYAGVDAGIIEPGFLLGLMLLAAFLGGGVARIMHVPRVVGYMLGGVLLKILITVIAARQGDMGFRSALDATAASATPLGGLTDLALGLILFSIGAVFEASHIRSVGTRALRIAAAEMGLTLGLVAIGCTGVAVLTETWSVADILAMSLFLGIAAIATAPAATLLVLREYEAKGPMTDMLLTLTGINNIVGIVLFHVAFLVLASAGVIATHAEPGRLVLVDLFLTTIGSALLGLILGVALSWFYAKREMAETFLAFLAVLLALGAGRDWLDRQLHLSFSFLLTSMTIGAVFANVAINPERFNTSLNMLSTPIFAAFFVLAGFNLHLEDLPKLGWLGGAYLVCRTVGKLIGARFGVSWAGVHKTVRPFLGAALLCQAGVVIGLATFLNANWGSERDGRMVPSEYASVFYTIILGSVALFELSGPLLIKRVVTQGGEVKAVQLWSRRPTAPSTQGGSVTSILFESVLRMFGMKRKRKTARQEDVLARHVMRTNVKLLHESDPFAVVMHFVERSRFQHFPVADENDKLIGMIHFAELRDIIYEPMLRDLVTAGDLVDIDGPFVTVEQTVEELMKQFAKTDYAMLPVVEDAGSRRIVGMVEQRDVLRVAGPISAA